MTLRAQMVSVALAAMVVMLRGASPACAEGSAPAAAKPLGNWRETSLGEYRQHLVELGAVVEACAKARDTKACDPSLIGPDDRVAPGNAPDTERRLVRYGWLRALLSRAQEKDEGPVKPEGKASSRTQDKTQDKAQDKDEDDESDGARKDESQNKAQEKTQDQNQDKAQGKPAGTPVTAVKQEQPEEPARPPKPTTSQLLNAAELRLTQEIAQADAAAATAAAAASDHTAQRDAMKQILAGRDFRKLLQPTARDTFWEKAGEWLNRFWARAARITGQAAWVGRLIVWGFIVAICVGLVWGLIQMERRWRLRLVPETEAAAAGAASARDWQLWLKDARGAAAAGQWRDAVHFVYWAAISRLESKRLWPADRARTPREYLALVATEDPRRSGLATLTGSFERTWYGGRAAAESDYRKAEELAAGLISGGSSTGAEAGKGGGL
ncbi:MAG: DUF4129 domain-containing protein [Terracidiphilus sp.]